MACIAVQRSSSWLLALVALFVAAPASAASACTATASLASDLGSFSPAAVKAGAVPTLRSRAGLSCTSGIIKLLSGNYLKATFQSRNALKLLPASGAALPYVLSADQNGAVTIAQNGTVDYMQNDLVNVLGLLGGTAADLPFFVRPASGTAPAEGTYTDRLTIKWDWLICQGIGALGACVLGADTGTATTVVDVTLTVAAKKLVLTAVSKTTWDPVNRTTFPKALPGGKRRIDVLLSNPDIVATDGDVTVVVPIAPRQALALDGDGATSGPPLTFAMTPAGSSVAMTYDGPASTTDDVDFSADQGVTWGYVPGQEAAGSSPRTNAIRFRPRGRVPAGATLDLSFPVTVQ